MSSSPIKEFGQACWSEVYNRIIGAAVFLDDSSAECLHWDGGLFNLLSGGAVEVKSLSPFERALKDHKKAVFITQATPTQLRTVREIIIHSQLTHCILICTVSLDLVFIEMNEGRDVSDVVAAGRGPAEAAKQLEGLMVEWLNRKPCSTEVVHVPIFTISPSSSIFTTPPYSKTFPTFNGEIIPTTPTIGLYTITPDERSQVRRLASSLNSMMGAMGYKEDVYHMGQYSSLVAGVLENSPVCLHRRKNCTKPTTLILVDGTLDLCAVTSHGSESVLDKIMAVLPRFPGHSLDVAVNMSPLCEADVVSETEDLQLSPGCLRHDTEGCAQTFEHMIHKSQKEVMFDVYNKLSKIDVQRSPGPKTLLKVTTQSVDKIITAAKGNYGAIEPHLGLLQQSLALVQTLKSPQYSLIELMTSLERQVVQNVVTSREATSVLIQISNLIKSRKERKLPLERLLALLVHIYSLAGTQIPFNRQHEALLTQTLSVALFEEHKQELFSAEGGQVASPEECEQVAKRLVARLRDVGQMRASLTRYNSVLKLNETKSEHEYTSVLQQLVEDLVNPARPDMPDLKHRGDGIKDLLKSGLSILTSKKPRAAKHPIDNQHVIIFIIGGVTAEQTAKIQQAVTFSGTDATVTLGALAMYTAAEAAKRTLRFTPLSEN